MKLYAIFMKHCEWAKK